MPSIYKVRLAGADGAFREVATVAESESEAQAIAEAQEKRYVEFDAAAIPAIDDSHISRLDELTAKFEEHPSDDPKVVFSGNDRAHWLVHHQTEPYTIDSVEHVQDVPEQEA